MYSDAAYNTRDAHIVRGVTVHELFPSIEQIAKAAAFRKTECISEESMEIEETYKKEISAVREAM